MPDLKLIAFDTEDLGVVSAHLQDAVLRVGEMCGGRRARPSLDGGRVVGLYVPGGLASYPSSV